MTDRELDELRLLGEELRAVFAAEREAIAKLDYEQLRLLADTKQLIAARLAPLAAVASKQPELKALFEAIRVEARATALLSATATNLVNAMLGRETNGYDKKANRVTSAAPSFRNLRAY